MQTVLIASVPIHGHVNQLLGVARGLVARGYAVRFLTGRRFEAAVQASGAQFSPLPLEADYDDRLLGERDDRPRKTGLAAIRRDVSDTFLRPSQAQYRGLVDEIAAQPISVVIADPTFLGAMLLAGHPASERPAVIGGGVLPLGLSSRHVAPFGLALPPMSGPLNIIRNTVLRLGVEKVVLGGIQRELDAMFRAVHGRKCDAFGFNWFSTVDAVVQFSVASFEYPRPDITVEVHFAGPADRGASRPIPVPAWWPELESAERVVVVTQGTIANSDFGELVLPTIEALANEPGIVVVTTGGRPMSDLGPLPSCVRAAEFLPYDRLLPLTDVFVTNGGYGGIHFPLEHAVPVIVAGDTEDKPEVAARVAWSGVGINLRTGRPRVEDIREAVHAVLREPSYRRAAERVAADIAQSRGVDELVSVMTSLQAKRSAAGASVEKSPLRKS